MNLPNLITVGRILCAPIVAWLAMSDSLPRQYGAFALFLVAAFSDLYDGYLARRFGWVTDLGKIADPIADKLLALCTALPLYFIGGRPDAPALPFWGALPLWVVLLILGREVLVTVGRSFAARGGTIISAARLGKFKALSQNFLFGGMLLWYPLSESALGRENGWIAWMSFHGGWIAFWMVAAVVLTVASMIDYGWRYRRMVLPTR